jgi:ABC-type transport system substrate-binding protein
MVFMVPNEFLIGIVAGAYWEPPPNFRLSLADKAALRNVGIQTVIEFLDWSTIEPARGEYDFSVMDEMIRINREAGIKTIFSAPGEKSPTWMSDKWMVKDSGGNAEIRLNAPDWRISSLWNEEAQEYGIEYLKLLVKKYHAPDVLFILGEFMGGEAILPCEHFYYDEFAVADYKKRYGTKAYPNVSTQETKDWLQEAAIKIMVRKYEILNKHGEIWNQQQLLMDDWSQSTINYAQKSVLRAYKTFFPDSHMVLMQYTYWDSSHTERHRNHVDEIEKEFQCDVIVEAMWPTGLPVTTPGSIAKGYRGQVIGTEYQGVAEMSLEAKVLDAIKESHRQWLESSQ